MLQPRRTQRRFRVLGEVIAVPPPFADLGISEAQAFYDGGDAAPISPNRRAALAQCKWAVAEHLDAAREALTQMQAVELEPLLRMMDGDSSSDVRATSDSTAIEETPAAWVRRDEAAYEFGTQWVRFARALRTFANEGRAALESLVYEFALTFDALPLKKTGEEQPRDIGFYTPRTAAAFDNRAKSTGSASLRALDAHFTRTSTEPFFLDLDTVRRVAYHRNLPYIVAFSEIEGDATTGFLPDAAPPLRFYRPQNLEHPSQNTPHAEPYAAFCAITLAQLTGAIDEAYGIAALAIAEVYPAPANALP